MVHSINLSSLSKQQLNRYIKDLHNNLIYLLNEASDDINDIEYCRKMLNEAKKLL